jgi:hypothetical protein
VYRFRWFMTAFSMVLALAPFSGVIAAALLASALRCELNDAAAIPCNVRGEDFGPLLSDLTLTAGLGGVVFLILAIVLAVWALIESFAFLFRWSRSGSQDGVI